MLVVSTRTAVEEDERTVFEFGEVVLEVRLGTLATSADRHGVVFEAVARGGELVKVGSALLKWYERCQLSGPP